MIQLEGGAEHCSKPLTPANDIEGPYKGTGNNNEWGNRYADMITRIMGAEMSAIPHEYDRACSLEHPGGVSATGHEASDEFWMGLRASFPSAVFTVHHCIGRDDDTMPPRAAVRWSLHGTHDGWGAFGAPTHADVYILGISHAEYGPYGLRREWVLYDEAAIWKQIVLETG